MVTYCFFEELTLANSIKVGLLPRKIGLYLPCLYIHYLTRMKLGLHRCKINELVVDLLVPAHPAAVGVLAELRMNASAPFLYPE